MLNERQLTRKLMTSASSPYGSLAASLACSTAESAWTWNLMTNCCCRHTSLTPCYFKGEMFAESDIASGHVSRNEYFSLSDDGSIVTWGSMAVLLFFNLKRQKFSGYDSDR